MNAAFATPTIPVANPSVAYVLESAPSAEDSSARRVGWLHELAEACDYEGLDELADQARTSAAEIIRDAIESVSE